MKNLVKLLEQERKILLKKLGAYTLVRSSIPKNAGGKTYYVREDDHNTMKVVAEMRGYKDITDKNGKFISAEMQCVEENIYG